MNKKQSQLAWKCIKKKSLDLFVITSNSKLPLAHITSFECIHLTNNINFVYNLFTYVIHTVSYTSIWACTTIVRLNINSGTSAYVLTVVLWELSNLPIMQSTVATIVHVCAISTSKYSISKIEAVTVNCFVVRLILIKNKRFKTVNIIVTVDIFVQVNNKCNNFLQNETFLI